MTLANFLFLVVGAALGAVVMVFVYRNNIARLTKIADEAKQAKDAAEETLKAYRQKIVEKARGK
jgi:uncharacterized membrane-anchored protein YhcB (DUF1043 family)